MLNKVPFPFNDRWTINFWFMVNGISSSWTNIVRITNNYYDSIILLISITFLIFINFCFQIYVVKYKIRF